MSKETPQQKALCEIVRGVLDNPGSYKWLLKTKAGREHIEEIYNKHIKEFSNG